MRDGCRRALTAKLSSATRTLHAAGSEAICRSYQAVARGAAWPRPDPPARRRAAVTQQGPLSSDPAATLAAPGRVQRNHDLQTRQHLAGLLSHAPAPQVAASR